MRLTCLIVVAAAVCSVSIAQDTARPGPRLSFLQRQFDSDTDAGRQLVRLHLYDSDPKVQALALMLLDRANDTPTLLTRHLLHNPTLTNGSQTSIAQVSEYLENIADLEVLAKVVDHTAAHAYHKMLSNVPLDRSNHRLKRGWTPRFDDKSSAASPRKGWCIITGGPGFDQVEGQETDTHWEHPDRALPQRTPGILFRHAPVRNGWTRSVGRFSTAPIVSDGSFYMADGAGNLIAGSMATGELHWTTPFPIPPHAQLTVADGVLTATFRSNLDTVLLCRFDASTGQFRDAALQPRPDRVRPFVQHQSVRVVAEYQPGGNVLIATKGDTELWRKPIDRHVRQLTVDGPKLYILTRPEIRSRGQALACIDLATGKPDWALPIKAADRHMALQFIDHELVWLVDDTSSLFCIDKATGACIVRVRLSNFRFAPEIVAVAFDPGSGNLLIDPSHGAVYAVDRQTLLARYCHADPRDRTVAFDRLFLREVTVKRIPQLKEDPPATDDEGKPVKAIFNEPVGGISKVPRTARARFHSITTKDWRICWKRYKAAIIAKAQALDLDAKNLEECFAAIEPAEDDKIALIPVAAFRTRYKGREAWIIVCNWEYPRQGRIAPIMHVREWAIDVETKEILGFCTCG
ncbi:MAG: outer membrane protein assembly factor BamB family protein [Planctomycetota bacterium]|jgi:hypothetical protein